MASINKLSIQGIRSFDPQATAVISFDKPLTVIVGPNGSGKTVRRWARGREDQGARVRVRGCERESASESARARTARARTSHGCFGQAQ